ncbi:hypothetical protein [Kaistella yonginensis]|uniref:hypothetical protein n=1 Tax=Kaistella yonginensis TaxID=658267 RepID=UPI0025B4CD4A|nr:hypothetical protein [Kaistella yonginensis]MDN3606386.1 hypothetical protein [Kaistella yonginensis]
MDNNLQINVSDLKTIINLLALKVNKLNENDSFSIDRDLYWNIPENELYKVYENPSNLTIGSIVEDWEYLEKIISEKREIIDYDLHKLSIILKFISNKIPI